MAAAVATIGSPISHGGSITAGSGDVFVNGIGVARLGDAVLCAVHGAQHITSASATVSADNKGIARVGDSISCGAVISGGSPNTEAG